MKWILIVVFTTIGSNSGVSITSVNGFETQQLCEAAGKKAAKDLSDLTTRMRHSCVQTQGDAKP